MDTTTIIVIAILLIAVIFLGITVISGNSSLRTGNSNSYSGQVLGGGCGR